MNPVVQAANYKWFKLATVEEVLELGRVQNHCLAERCHYHDDFEAGILDVFACYENETARIHSGRGGRGRPCLFAVALKGALIEIGTDKSGPPPQKHIAAVIALANAFDEVWDVDGNIQEAGVVKINGKWMSIRDLPIKADVEHDLNLNNINSCHELPNGLVVYGDLSVCKTQINKLPEDIIVYGKIDNRYTYTG